MQPVEQAVLHDVLAAVQFHFGSDLIPHEGVTGNLR